MNNNEILVRKAIEDKEREANSYEDQGCYNAAYCYGYAAGAVSQTHALPVDLTLEEIEQIAVQQALQAENGNQKRAAERLGISRTTLWRMLQKETPHPYRR